MIITVQEASKLTGLTEQAIRCGLRAKTLPFGFAFKSEHSSCWSYRIIKRRLELWLSGQL